MFTPQIIEPMQMVPDSSFQNTFVTVILRSPMQ